MAILNFKNMKKQYHRLSNRVYPKKMCRQGIHDFIPTDARQEFCCVQHRIDYNNDKRAIKNAPLKKIALGLTKNEGILKKAHLFMQKHEHGSITVDFLLYDGYDFNLPCTTSISNTGNKIEWQLSFGIEGIAKEKKLFKIHKK